MNDIMVNILKQYMQATPLKTKIGFMGVTIVEYNFNMFTIKNENTNELFTVKGVGSVVSYLKNI